MEPEAALSMKRRSNKVMSAEAAVASCVLDSTSLSVATFCNSSPYALVHEVIRQRKKDLTLLNQSCFEEMDLLVAGGCARRMISAYVSKAGIASETPITRALRNGTLEIEEYSNFAFAAMLQAGGHGLPFGIVSPAIIHSDIFRKRSFAGEDKFRVIKCPYSGKDVVTVPPLTPDVAIVHAQRADAFGNTQYWGTPGSNKMAAMAAKRIIVSVEEVVDSSLVKGSYQYTMLPGFMVDAVVPEPFGSHPAEVMGYYRYDKFFRGQIWAQFSDAQRTQDLLEEWIFGVKDRNEYLQRFALRFGPTELERLRTHPTPSDSVRVGTLAEPLFDETGHSRLFGLSRDEMISLLEAGPDSLRDSRDVLSTGKEGASSGH